LLHEGQTGDTWKRAKSHSVSVIGRNIGYKSTLDFVFFILGYSPASEFYVPKRRHIKFRSQESPQIKNTTQHSEHFQFFVFKVTANPRCGFEIAVISGAVEFSKM
jgi:hypothetical protein